MDEGRRLERMVGPLGPQVTGGDLSKLLVAADNDDVSAPAPPHALFLDRVRYPDDLYLTTE